MNILDHMKLLDSGQDISTAIAGQYDSGLVLLSFLIAILSAYTAFLVSERITASNKRTTRVLWLAAGSLSLGGGVWAMHFIGMLAYQLPMTINYDSTTTLISMIPGVLASIVVLHSEKEKTLSQNILIVRSVLMGSGIGAMHYIGMAAMQTEGVMRYDLSLFIISIIVAVILAWISLRLKQWADTIVTSNVIFSWHLLGAAIIMGCAITGMHYTGMAAMYVFPEAHDHVLSSSWSTDVVIEVIVLIVMLITALLIIAIAVSHQFDLYERIKSSEVRQNAILENIPDGIVTINENGIIESINDAMKSIFKYKANEIIGRNIITLLTKPFAYEYGKHLEHDSKDNPSMNNIKLVDAVKKDGSVFPIELVFSKMELEERMMYTVIIRDITMRRRMEIELDNHREHLEELVHNRTAEINDARNEAERANAAKSEFLANMSHELRTPMHGVLSFAQLGVLRLEDVPLEKLKHYFEGIETSGQRLLGLLNNLLDLAKLEAGKVELERAEHNIEVIIEECFLELSAKMKEQQLILVIDKPNTLPTINCDALQIKQVIINLLSNAMKFSIKGSEITIRYLIKDNNEFEFQVSDKGPGIKTEDLERIFEKFTQSGPTVEDTGMGSSGLGLAICKEIITKHLGEIWASHNENSGATLTFTLP